MKDVEAQTDQHSDDKRSAATYGLDSASEQSRIAQNFLWKRGPIDHFRAALLSSTCQACTQLSLSESHRSLEAQRFGRSEYIFSALATCSPEYTPSAC